MSRPANGNLENRVTPTSNIVKGRVEIKGTRTGVSGLIVRVFDVRSDDDDEERWPLGSTVTQNGNFKVQFDDADFAHDRDDGERPSIQVTVNAPEGSGNSDGLLFESALRENAAREECFLFHIDQKKLRSHKVLVPTVAAGAAGDPAAAEVAAENERQRRAGFRAAMTKVRRNAVAEARTAEVEIESEIKDRVLQHLTGLPPRSPALQRFVPPGGDVREITRTNQETTIKAVINPQAGDGAVTYLALSEDEFDALHDAAGVLVSARVEQKLRQKNPTPSLLREDPAVLACLRRRERHPFDEEPPPDPPPPPPPPDDNQTATVDAKVAELVDSIRSPEDLIGGGRPDQDSVAINVQNLKLSKGPADVAALYDFHNLQIAFDHVWEDARAEGVIEQAKVIYRALNDLGGDPKQALRDGTNPVRALTKELRVVRQAQARLAAPTATATPSEPGVVYMRAPIKVPSGSDLEVVIDPWPPVQPPPPPPPGGDVSVDPGTIGVDPNPPPEPPPDPTGGEGYPFSLFADKSTNFGLLVTYRQCWEPVHYQVGRLVGTLTLAPKESISITTRQVVKTSFNRKQVESSQESRSAEASDTQREDAEIVSRAQSKTNFALTTQGSFDLGPLGEGSYTTAFSKDAESHSQETKRSMREAVRREAQKLSSERQNVLESGEASETENVQKREISNPNDELAITYIFYELQRLYRVWERLHRVVPVVLVGQYVPRPAEINDDWIRRHDWIIKRFLPDDSFRPALTYLATRERGDKIVLEDLWYHMDTIRASVRELKNQVLTARNEAYGRYAAIEQLVNRKAMAERAEDREGWFEKAFEALEGSNDISKDALRILEDAAREGYERAVREERDLRARLEREITALQVATDAYTKARADYTNQRLQIDRLTRQVIDNILHYMHGIWSYKQPDQRFFEHHTLMAPRLEAIERTYTLEPMQEWPVGVTPQPGKTCFRVTFTAKLPESLGSAEQHATLAELADLDRPLGFKGNYIIYPLKKSNALTDFMMTPYLDAELGLRDPDELGNWTLEEFSDFVACLRESLTEAEFDAIRPDLLKQYQKILSDPLRDGEEITVPTTSMYMQMIVDSGKALEDFKAAHRLMDVMKVKTELRGSELDNLRRAKLVLTDQLDDPNVESVKNVFYRGDVPPHDGDE